MLDSLQRLLEQKKPLEHGHESEQKSDCGGHL